MIESPNIMNEPPMRYEQKKEHPGVWVVVLGFNNAADTVECLKSLANSTYRNLTLLFVDNESKDDSVARILAEVPSAYVLQTGQNLGFSKGYNVGIDYSLRQGADYVFMINNDTVVDPSCISELVRVAEANTRAGIVVPKIFYHDHPGVIWSAGSRYRKVPPSIVMRKTVREDDGRYDQDRQLDFATTCALLLSRTFLMKVGLLDADYFIMYDDYDLSLRCRAAGYEILLVPSSHLWHKVSKSTGVGTRSPAFWIHYGRSTALFFRKHRKHRWMTSPVHLLYILVRMVAEGKVFGVKPFLKGYGEGTRAEMRKPPLPLKNETDPFEVVRKIGGSA